MEEVRCRPPRGGGRGPTLQSCRISGWIQSIWNVEFLVQLLAGVCYSAQSPSPSLMQRNTIFLTLIIPGPDYPGKNLSAYMQPLVDDLNHSWHYPTLTYDRASRTNFFMKVWYQY